MSLININGDDHVYLAGAFFGQVVDSLDADDLGQLQGYPLQLRPSVASFQVAGFDPIIYDGFRPNGLDGILKLSAFFTEGGDAECPDLRPTSGILYP